MRRSRPWRYLLVNYPLQQGKMNPRRLFLFSSGSRSSVLTMAGMVLEGPNTVSSLSLFTFLCLSLLSDGGCWKRESPFIFYYLLQETLGVAIKGWEIKCIQKKLFAKRVFPLYFRRLIRGSIFGGVFSEILLLFKIYFIDIFQFSFLGNLSTCHPQALGCVYRIFDSHLLTPYPVCIGCSRIIWQACYLFLFSSNEGMYVLLINCVYHHIHYSYSILQVCQSYRGYFFFSWQYSCLDVSFWSIGELVSSRSHHFLKVRSARLVTILSLILFFESLF